MTVNLDDIRDQLDIVTVIEDYGYPLTKNGSEYVGHISPTSKSGKSLRVDPVKQRYCDFSGHADKGDVLNFIAYAEGLDNSKDFVQVLHIAAEKVGIVLDNNIDYSLVAEKRELHLLNRIAFTHYNSLLTEDKIEYIQSKWGTTKEIIDNELIGWAPENCRLQQVPEIKDYFSTEILEKSGLFYCNDDGKLVDIYRGRFVFPYWHNGEPVYSIARDPKWDKDKTRKKFIKQLVNSEKFPYVSHAVENVLYGIDSLKGNDTVYVTEGIADAIALKQAGKAVLSPVTIKFKDSDINNVVKACKSKKLVKIVNDNEDNESGLKGAIDTAKALESNGIRAKIVILPKPDGIDKIDVAEYMLSHTAEELEKLPGHSVWDVLLSREPVPESSTDKSRAFKEFIVNNLVDMDPIERTVFCREAGKDHFGLTVDIINRILKRTTFSSGSGQYFTGDGSFIPVKLSEVLQKTERYVTTDNGIAVYNPETGCYQWDGENRIRKDVRDALGLLSTEKCGDEVVYDISTCTRADIGIFNQDRGLVNLRNGYIDIYTGELFEHSPDTYFTYALPFDYDASAKCPKFLEFIDATGIDRIDVFEMLAYMFVPRYPIHSIHVLVGDGGNGKGTLIRLINKLLGSQNTTGYTMQELTKDPYAKAGLFGKLANLCGDMPGNRVEDTAILKSLSGEDEVNARNIYGKPFKYINRAKLVFPMNHMPEFDDNTDSTYRRLVILQFKNLVDGVTEGFSEDAMAAELSGVFNEALKVLPNLLRMKKFNAWVGIEETRNIVQLKSDSIGAFFDRCVIIGSGETPVQAAYTAYTKFCTDVGETRETNIVFGRRIKKLYPDDIQRIGRTTAGERTMFYSGMELKEGYKNLSAEVVDHAYLNAHVNKMNKCDTDKTQSDTDMTQIKNLINQQHENDLVLNDTDNSTIFNNNLECSVDKIETFNSNIDQHVDFAVSDGEKAPVDNETSKNYLCHIYGSTVTDADLSMSGTSSGDMHVLIEECLDQWEKFGGVIFSKNAHKAKLDIVGYHKMYGINPQLIYNAIDKRVNSRCVDCGNVDAPNRSESITGVTQHRCRDCYIEYQKLTPVKLPEVEVIS